MPIIQVTPNVYQITDRRANMFLLIGQKITVIDAAFRSSVPLVAQTLQESGRSPRDIELVILTHNHLDHTGGIGELKKLAPLKIAANKVDFDIRDGFIPMPGGVFTRTLFKLPLFSIMGRRMLLDKTMIDIELSDGQVLTENGGLQVIFTPGHTPGSISLYAPEEKILFVGDALNKRYGLPLRAASMNNQQAARSILKLAELDVNILCFGHGKPIKVGAAIYMRNLAEKLQEKQKD
ncbi:MAG: MBL fold metallo-hydrolase [Dehalococcoidales bacterium]|nr:MBL fold metallo-hydrolase [Dehalococcoidales bacterium]